MSEAIAVPGEDRVITFKIGEAQFGFRRPSRADVAEAYRRCAMKLILPDGRGRTIESDNLDRLDGGDLHWEARLEIGLRPRPGKDRSIGERAPEHWLVPLGEGENAIKVVSFDGVDPDEFAAVVAYLEEKLKKNPTQPAPFSKPVSDPA